jgi:Xaa-Pro dipeptidase
MAKFRLFLFASTIFAQVFLTIAPAQQGATPTPERIAKLTEIQRAVREQGIDGWLLYDFRGSNVFAQRVLELPREAAQSRRFFYLIPATGEPKKLVHSIERWTLDSWPGEKVVYLSWQSLREGVCDLLKGARRIAMEYSPNGNIPYISRVDAGTIEMVRQCGVEVVSSGDLVNYFEARWTEEQFRDNVEVASIMRRVVDSAFSFIRENVLARRRITEYDVQQHMVRVMERAGVVGGGPNVSVDANTANPHYGPRKDRAAEVKEGSFVLIDFVGRANKPNAVYSDITWVGYVGSSVPEKYVEIWNIVKGARDVAIEFMRRSFSQGKTIRGYEVDEVARKYIADRGYADHFLHRTGHNIGREGHGNGTHMDGLETFDDRKILTRTSNSIEPGIYLLGDFGVRSEIDVYITEDGKVIVTGEPIQEEVVAILK